MARERNPIATPASPPAQLPVTNVFDTNRRMVQKTFFLSDVTGNHLFFNPSGFSFFEVIRFHSEIENLAAADTELVMTFLKEGFKWIAGSPGINNSRVNTLAEITGGICLAGTTTYTTGAQGISPLIHTKPFNLTSASVVPGTAALIDAGGAENWVPVYSVEQGITQNNLCSFSLPTNCFWEEGTIIQFGKRIIDGSVPATFSNYNSSITIRGIPK